MEIANHLQGNKPISASKRSIVRWNDRSIPYRMTGNKDLSKLVGTDQFLMALFYGLAGWRCKKVLKIQFCCPPYELDQRIAASQLHAMEKGVVAIVFSPESLAFELVFADAEHFIPCLPSIRNLQKCFSLNLMTAATASSRESNHLSL